MKKAIIAIVIIIAILAAAAVGVTAYASDGYTLPVDKWGERLGIAGDKTLEEDNSQNQDDNVAKDPDKEPEDATGDSEEENNKFMQFERKRYFISETGEEIKNNAHPLKDIFYDLKPVAKSENYMLNILLQDSNAPGQKSEGGIIIKLDYLSGVVEDIETEILYIYYLMTSGTSEGQIKVAAIVSAKDLTSGITQIQCDISDEFASEYGVGFIQIDGLYMA